jgi:hypothetical protein
MTEITKDDVLAVGYGRVAQIYNNFPELKREDFNTDDEYLKALQQQYIDIRKQEYEYVCMQQSYETYLASRCVNDQDCRAVMFSSVSSVAGSYYNFVDEEEPSSFDDLEDLEDSRYTISKVQSDSTAVNNAARYVYACHKVDSPQKTTKTAHCAMTALRILTGVSNRLGYVDADNFAYGAMDGANAGLIHGRNAGTGKIVKNFAIKKGKYSVQQKGKRLKDLILSGQIGPGDVISIGADNGSNDPEKVSGYHALTVASVNRDENGEIVSYTLMDNNGGDVRTRLQVHDINGDFGRKTVLYTKTHQWANDMFEQEIQGKTSEDLQQMIAQTRNYMCEDLLIDLARNECTLLCDETYLTTCGKTLKGVDRKSELQTQQIEFRTFYSKQYADLMEMGLAEIEKMKEAEIAAGLEIPSEVGPEVPGETASVAGTDATSEAVPPETLSGVASVEGTEVTSEAVGTEALSGVASLVEPETTSDTVGTSTPDETASAVGTQPLNETVKRLGSEIASQTARIMRTSDVEGEDIHKALRAFMKISAKLAVCKLNEDVDLETYGQDQTRFDRRPTSEVAISSKKQMPDLADYRL